ncbi:DNA-binding domain-containing protein [Puniceibacterium sp. IMCC21224]|uniref:HvfC/BufC N-terminal domain-containing protein n=1 Tax=Puniceibacterium sp. IMCC21224 TaxID=1618204 RepID=UPI00064DEE7E|nr:DNA-binding domain-containing protein [Puniceibacterium sp. IMCC21224]KMK67907.1 hypothetical protein IMCC21224_112784 [Puniceibacterium sp. IMCC21224]
MTDQSSFHAALLDATQPVPKGLTDGAGRPAGRRYAVYRNNVVVSLRDALETGFPVISRLLGAENFHHIAGVYLRSALPADPRLMTYGAGFPVFLAGFPALAHLPYLADVARLELALRHSYHAADHAPADAAVLQKLTPDTLLFCRLTLAPSVYALQSPYPVWSIWCRNSRKTAPKPPARAEDYVILRPEFDPEPHLLPPGGAALVAALGQGAPLGGALDAAGDDFDPGATLGLLLANGAITHIETER